MSEQTILDLYRHDANAALDAHYAHHGADGARTLSTAEFFGRTAELAEALAGLGLRQGDRVALMADNRPEWHMIDLAVLSLGAADVPLYPTLTPEQAAYQLADSGARILFVETFQQAVALEAVRTSCPALEHVVQIEGATPAPVTAFDALLQTGRREDVGDRFWERAATVRADDLATIVYTSGTTGSPKGVMLTHGNFVANVLAVEKIADLRDDDLVLEFLPLCHVYERCAGYVYMRFAVPRAYCATSRVAELIATIRPTYFASVPRIFEKVYDRVHSRVADAPAVRQKLFSWAIETGREVALRRLAGQPAGPGLRLKHRLADRLVLAKIRQALGGRLRSTLSGAAPLPVYAAEFFHALGIWVQEGYGLTETSPVISANGAHPGENRLGTVGRALANVEVRIAEDGELLARGPSVFSGYWNKPEQTAEVFDSDGFFHTGDVASIDADGFITITDRKKDLIVTAGGKNVAPQPIENRLKASKFVENAVLVGDRRPYIVALLAPNEEELERWAAQNAVVYRDFDDLVRTTEVHRLYSGVVTKTNASLARYEQIKLFRVLPAALTIEGGQLTPTMKIKRRVVEKEYASLIDQMYATSTHEEGGEAQSDD